MALVLTSTTCRGIADKGYVSTASLLPGEYTHVSTCRVVFTDWTPTTLVALRRCKRVEGFLLGLHLTDQLFGANE